MKKTLFTAMTICAALTACNTNKVTVTDFSAQIPGKWTILTAGDQTTENVEEKPFINFSDSGTVNGYAAVNTFFGSYTAKEDSLSFSNLGMTMMAGPDMDIEMAIMQAINSSKTIAIQGDTLLMKNAEGNTVMTLKRD